MNGVDDSIDDFAKVRLLVMLKSDLQVRPPTSGKNDDRDNQKGQVAEYRGVGSPTLICEIHF